MFEEIYKVNSEIIDLVCHLSDIHIRTTDFAIF